MATNNYFTGAKIKDGDGTIYYFSTTPEKILFGDYNLEDIINLPSDYSSTDDSIYSKIGNLETTTSKISTYLGDESTVDGATLSDKISADIEESLGSLIDGGNCPTDNSGYNILEIASLSFANNISNSLSNLYSWIGVDDELNEKSDATISNEINTIQDSISSLQSSISSLQSNLGYTSDSESPFDYTESPWTDFKSSIKCGDSEITIDELANSVSEIEKNYSALVIPETGTYTTASGSSLLTKNELGTLTGLSDTTATAVTQKTGDNGTCTLMINGLTLKSNGSSTKTAFTIAEGFRPKNKVVFLASGNNSVLVRGCITTSGEVQFYWARQLTSSGSKIYSTTKNIVGFGLTITYQC